MQLEDILSFYANPHVILVRLKARCTVAGEPGDEHWIYRGAHKDDGQFFLSHKEVAPLPRQVKIRNGKTVSARRLMYLLYYKEIPDGANVKTLCGVRSCMNPDHLTIRGREKYEDGILRGVLVNVQDKPAISPVKQELKDVEDAVTIFDAKQDTPKHRKTISVTDPSFKRDEF
jgi:hypothetical protein